MRLLVLGGTAFVGRRLVEVALERDHTVTLFTRGRTNPDLFPQAEQIRGDREEGLAGLAGREFDAAIDTCGYLPRLVGASTRELADRIDRYVFVSSLSVYADAPSLVESGAVQIAADPDSEDLNGAYGELKALCERAVEAILPARSLIVRPGLIVGRHDYTGRFVYWPRRVATGGEILAPGRPDARVWLIDVDDLAAWMIRMVEQRATGIYNTVGPGLPLTMAELLETCREVTGSDATFTWVDDSFLLGHGVVPYTELPLWVPDLDGGYPFVDTGRAVAAGLTFRPIEETIRAVLDPAAGYDPAVASGFGLTRSPAGLTRERERALLADWHDDRAPVWDPRALEPSG